MIDFRYHIVSIVAVFLSLGVGIMIGSGFLGEPLLEQLRRNVESVRDDNSDLRAEIDELRGRLQAEAGFVEASKAYLVSSALAGERVVLFTFAGSDGEVVDGVRAAFEDAGAEVVSVVTLDERFALDGEDDAAALAAALGVPVAPPDELRAEAGRLIGARAALVAAADPRGPSPLAQRLDDLLAALVEAGFAEVEDGGAPVLPGSSFVVVGGAAEEDYPVAELALPLSQALASQAAQVLVAAPLDDAWGLVAAVRSEADAAAEVTTVDFADLPAGQVAAVMALDHALATGAAGHYGVHDGAEAVIPAPSAGS
jgi:cell division septum initiation protein DivIVA